MGFSWNSCQESAETVIDYWMIASFHTPVNSSYTPHSSDRLINWRNDDNDISCTTRPTQTQDRWTSVHSDRVQLTSRNGTCIRYGLCYVQQNNGNVSHNSRTHRLANKSGYQHLGLRHPLATYRREKAKRDVMSNCGSSCVPSHMGTPTQAFLFNHSQNYCMYRHVPSVLKLQATSCFAHTAYTLPYDPHILLLLPVPAFIDRFFERDSLSRM